MSKALAALGKALESAIGENSENQGVTHFIDTGYPPLNEIISGDLNGGIPQGRMGEMYGPSSSGKTALATQFLIQAQKLGGVAGFMDHERSFAIKMAEKNGLKGVFPQWIYRQPRTWEESNMLMAKAAETIRKADAIDPKAPILFVFDSIAAALPKSVIDKGLDELTMNDTTALARVTSTTLKSMADFTEQFNFSILYLNQIRTKPGVVYGDPTTTPGGGAMEFYASFRIALARTKLMEERMVHGKKEKVFVGQEIRMKTTKNKLTRPFQEIEWRMMFDEDGSGYFDVTFSLIEWLVECGKLEYSQPYVTWLDGKKYSKKVLAKKIDDEGLQVELRKLAV